MTPREKVLEELAAEYKTSCNSVSVRAWADGIFADFGTPTSADVNYVLIPTNRIDGGILSLHPAFQKPDGTVDFDENGKVIRLSFIWGSGRLTEGIAVYRNAKDANDHLHDNGYDHIKVGEGIYVWVR